MENKPQIQLEGKHIDFGKFAGIAMAHKKQVGSIIVGCTIFAAGISFVLPKQYESTTLVQARNGGVGTGNAAAMAAAMGLQSGFSIAESYMELMKTRRVLEPIINDMEWENEDKKPKVDDFAKQYLKITNIKQTNIITIKAKGKSPEEAQKISQSVAENFLAMQTDMNQETQSLLMNFLEKRIEEAKKEAEESRAKFGEYQKEHKIYSPDEQAKAAVSRMKAFDEALGDAQVQEKTNQAKLETISEQLGDIRSSSQNFNINDSEIVMKLRKQIVDAQIDLVGLRERYTEENPNVISAKEKVLALQGKLVNEVNTAVASKYTTLNPAQAKLISEQANAEVNIAVAQASETAIKKRRDEEEKKLEDFPQDVLEYTELQRDSQIKDQIYTSLIKSVEERKLQKAMDSMDIQIIDNADLPDEDKPVAPKKKIITLIGLILGIVISSCRVFYMYCKESK